MIEVTRKRTERAGTSGHAPGEHYTLRRREAGRPSPGGYRYFTVYRSPRGGLVAGDIGCNGAYWMMLASDSPVFAELAAAVEAYDRQGPAVIEVRA